MSVDFMCGAPPLLYQDLTCGGPGPPRRIMAGSSWQSQTVKLKVSARLLRVKFPSEIHSKGWRPGCQKTRDWVHMKTCPTASMIVACPYAALTSQGCAFSPSDTNSVALDWAFLALYTLQFNFPTTVQSNFTASWQFCQPNPNPYIGLSVKIYHEKTLLQYSAFCNTHAIHCSAATFYSVSLCLPEVSKLLNKIWFVTCAI